MDLRFRTQELQQLCNRRAAMRARWGKEQAAALAQRLQELDAVESLGDLDLLPYVRLATAQGGREVMVEDRDGLRIRLAIDPNVPGPDGDVPWRETTAAVIVEIVVEGTDG